MSEKIEPLNARPEFTSGSRQCSRCAHASKDSAASMICGNGRRHSASRVCLSLMKTWAAPELVPSSFRVSVVCWPQYAQAK